MKKTLLPILLILSANLFAQQVTLTTSKTTIAENDSAIIVATLDAASSKDVTVQLFSKGTAGYNQDFKTNSAIVISTVAGGNGFGSAANQLSYPRAIFVDTSGNIYVSDLFNHRIQKWTPGALTGITIAGGSDQGSADNQLSYPEDVYVDTSGNIYISDSGNHRIQKWAPGAVTGITVAGGHGAGSAANQLSTPRAVFVDTSGNIYISDLMNNRIQKWTPGALNGITVAGGNGQGSAANQLNSPTGLFVDTSGNTYISDSSNYRIQKWTPGALTGITVAGGNGLGSAANQLNSPDGIFVDTSRNIYIGDYGNNRIIKWTPGALVGITVAGGNDTGSAANQLYNPSDVFVETSGNIYISDIGNSRIQKYQFAPQIVISAGQTSAQLIISGLEDNLDENNETIVLQPSVTNATLATTDPISITLTDNNDPPTVSFTFSAPKIAENSSTDVTLTASLSNVSGKDVEIDFLMEGTATEMGEYIVSSKHISIPENNLSGSITISTKGLDDTLVEVLESIVFKVSTITNATATLGTATLYLESDDNPKVSITTSKTTIAEHESTTITATLDQASSKDVILPILLSGTAGFNVDYTNSFTSKGEESLMATIPNYSNSYVQLSDGRYVFASNNTLIIYDPITKTQTTQSLQNYPQRLKVAGNVVYYQSMIQSIFKIDLSKSTPVEESVVTISEQNSSLSAFDVVGSTVYYNVTNYGTYPNNRKIYSKTGTAAAVIVYEPTQDVSLLSVDSSGFVYIADYNSIQRINTQNNVITNISGNIGGAYLSNITNMKLFKDLLYVNTLESGIVKIKKFIAANNSFETVDYSTINTKQIVDFSISADRNLQLLRQDINQVVLLYNYQLAPQLKILAGSTTAKITVTGIDDTNDEEDEIIVLTPETASNSTLNSNAPITVTITDNDEIPPVAFALSASKIVENSATTVTLTATPSVVSGKDITIPFTLSGTATPVTEYTVSANQIVIPANATSASVTISTKGLDDTAVEILETINFNIGTLINATTSSTLITLLLESDDNPTITSIVASPTTIAEHESATITATLDQASSKDVILPILLSGTAGFNVDYTSSFTSKGEESLMATIPNYSNSYVQLSDGRYVFASNNTLIIYDPITKTQTTQSLQNYPQRLKVAGNVVYYQSMSQSIFKIDLSKSTPVEESVVTISEQNSSLSAFDVVGSTVYYNVTNYGTSSYTRKIYSKTGVTSAVLVYEPAQDVSFLSVDSSGFIYIADYNSIQRINTQNNVVNSFSYISNLSNMKMFKDQLYVNTSDGNTAKIKKFNAANNSFETLNYATTNTKQIVDFSISADENLQLLRQQDMNQVLLYNYQLAPQLKILAGSTTATITLTGIDDTTDESDDTIVVTIGTASNATLNSNAPITVTITDNDELPTIAFTLSASKIVENAATTVTLTATPSVVSGKNITIPFTLSGTATPATEYTVSANQIVIPDNATSASVTISTKGLDDTIVEILEAINFNIGTLVNATTTTTMVTLNLESDDNPTITSIVATPTTIAEHESATITATLDTPSSRDVTISLESTGTALYDQDFKTNSAVVISTVAGGNGQGSAANQLNSPTDISIAQDGTIYVLESNNSRIQKWIPGASSGTTLTTLNSWSPKFIVDAIGTIYVLNGMDHRIQKQIIGSTTWETVAGGNGSGSAANQLSFPNSFFIDATGNIYVTDANNNRIQKWTPGATTGITVAGGNGNGSAANQLNNPRAVFVDASGNIYVNDSNNSRIQKWVPNATTGTMVLGSNGTLGYVYLGNNVEGLFVDAIGNIYLMSIGITMDDKIISKWTPGASRGITLAGGNGSGAALNQFQNPQSFTFDTKGNLYIADTGNHRIQKHLTSPQIVIPAGQTTAQLIVSGIEDNLETEGTELIVLEQTSVQNAILNSTEDIKIDIKDNTRTLTLNVDSPFTGLENGAVAWGDYDRDGDQDVAVMGTGISGAVTKLYENRNGVFFDTNQNFTKLYGGDISWVDLDKDGWIDLVVSGFNATPQTKVYINNDGTSFTPSTEYGLPHLYSSKMAWGDLDNDGDIDLAISGIDKDEKYVFNILYKEDNQNKFAIEPKTLSGSTCYICYSFQGFINGDLKIVDIDLDGDNDIIYNGQNSSGQAISNTIYNSYINTIIPNNYNYNTNLNLKNSVIEVAKMNASLSNLTIISSGVDSSGGNQFYASNSLAGIGGAGTESQYPKLKSGDIAVADYNNDGTNDILFTGEDAVGIPITKLYFQNTDGNYKPSTIVLQGLRNSTANWVDYDTDGDLDLFLTGTSETGGVKSLLYVSDIANKKNIAPAIVTGLIAQDLGNGKIKFKWNAPKDDYSTNLGYVIKLGTTPGGTELSNTESNLTTGARLITKQAPIYTGFYEMQLNPGKYYWSVQAVDTGLKGGPFSAEDSFTLTYDWKILNQGGIIDRSISGIEAPVIKLADLDNDNDLDLIYANAVGFGSQLLRFDGKKLIEDSDIPNMNSLPYIIKYLNNTNSLEVGDINGDGIADLVRNDFNSTNNLVLNLSNGTDYTSTPLAGGLFKSKIRIIDMNNDGKPEVLILGMSTNTLSGLPKLWIYEYDKLTNPPTFKKTDASAQIAPLANASFDLGDFDKDQDIDLIITGFSASDGLKCIIYENITELGGSFTLKATDNNLVAIKDGTTDFIDFDGDGDLDAVFTGTSISTDIFEIYINKLNEGITTWSRFSSGLAPMRQSKIDLGDFNGDGYCDLLYSGITGSGAGNVTKLSEYNPVTGAYIDSAFDVSDIQNAEVEFGDIDGDKDLDFVITGKNKNYIPNDPISKPYIFRTYLNVRNDSAKILASNGNKQSTSGKAGASTAATYVVNDSPSVPGLPSIPVKNLAGTSSKAGTYPIELSWLASLDDHTPSDGLTYAIKVGKTSGGEEILGANANVTGIRKISGKGNVEHNKKWRLSLPIGTYYWSVQAIDASYSGSKFSVSNKFEITAQGLASPVNVAPIAIADQITVAEGGTAATLLGGGISVLTNDTDAESNTLTSKLISGVTNGTLTLNNNGTFSYIHNGSETISDSFTYSANDGTLDSNIITVVITITPVNDAPIAVPDQILVLRGGTATTLVGGATGVLTNDTDAENNTLTASLVLGVTNGTLTLNPNGTFSYVHNGFGTTSDSFTYKVNDGTSDSNFVTVVITVTAVNAAPIAIADQIMVAEKGTSTTLVGGLTSVLTNDTDAESNMLTAKLVSDVTNGTLAISSNGTFSYVHNGSETTSDSFTYQANDGTLDSNVVTVVITVTPVNDAPTAVADQILVLNGGMATTLVGGATSVLTNDTDAENNTLTASLVSGVTNGTLTLNVNGTYSYVHNGSGTTSDSFTYKAYDGVSFSDIVSVYITIAPINSFTLPSTNFSVEVKDETCTNKNNGEINITAAESYSYVATINGKNYNFINNSLAVSNLTPGSYAICITIPGKVFEQCYTVNVVKGKTITGKIRATTNKVSVEIVEGTAPYQIFVNGNEQFETESTTFSVDVKKGDLLEVKTAKSCEGIYSKDISDLLGAIALYPNPTSGSFEINLSTSRKEVVIDLYTSASQLISQRTYPVVNERVQLDLGNEPSGVYIVKIYLDTPLNLTIIKN